MKEELQLKLVEILGSIQTAAGKAGDFAMAQLPDIAQSYVAYGRAYATFWIVVAVLLLIASVILTVLVAKKEAWEISPVLAVPYIVSVFIFMAHMSSFLLVWMTPKVWLLKELANMIQ